jgi:phosphatidylglycerophosphate synthase
VNRDDSMTAYIALALAGLAVLTMPLYAVVTRGRPIDPEVARRPTTVLLGYWIRDWVMWTIRPLERALIASRIDPAVLNVLGALLGLAAGVAYVERLPGLAGWCILLGGLADIMDGRIARARHMVSTFGEFLDSVLDRFAEVFTFVGLAFYLAWSPWGVLATALAVGSSLLVSYTRAKAGQVGVDCRGGVMQRAERLVLLALASLVDGPLAAAADWPAGAVLLAAVAVIGVGAFGTAVFRTVVVARVLRRS